MFIAYNLHRIMNIVGANELRKFFGELVFIFFSIMASIKAIRLKITHWSFKLNFVTLFFKTPLNKAVFAYF